MVNNFPVHGNVEFELMRPLLLIRMSFPFNDEAIATFEPQFRAHYAKMSDIYWGSVLVTTGLPLMSPEVRQSAVDSITLAIESGNVCTACVMLDKEFESTMKEYWADIYETVGLDFVFLDTEEAGIEWSLNYISKHTAKSVNSERSK